NTTSPESRSRPCSNQESQHESAVDDRRPGRVVLVPTAWGDPPKKAETKTYRVPYRLTDTHHIMVRVKINGKGPYNFIIDTGAPALYVRKDLSEKLGVKADKKGWGVFDRFEIEGGLAETKVKGRVETPFQLVGMNALGLPGVELHGI